MFDNRRSDYSTQVKGSSIAEKLQALWKRMTAVKAVTFFQQIVVGH